MKRRPLILAVVLTVAAVACIAPIWWEVVWLKVAYEPTVLRGAQSAGQNYGSADPELLVFDKRIEWLPGAELYVPPQECGACKKGMHDACHVAYRIEGNPRKPVGQLYWPTPSVGYTWGGEEYGCTCPTCHPERAK